MKTPDSFILNKELNVEPVRDLLDILVENPSQPRPSLPADDVDPLGADDLGPMAKGARERMATLHARQADVAAANERLSFLKGQVKQLFAALDVDRQRQIEAYKSDAVRPFLELIEHKEADIERLERSGRYAKATDSVARIRLSEAHVELAQLRRDEAKAAEQAATYVLANFGKFGASSLQDQARGIYDQQTEALAKLNAAREAERSAKVAIQDFLGQQASLRLSRLGWIDFIYFSVGVSTSNAFGDITPNSRTVRALVLVQIIFSMGLVAVFFDRLFAARASSGSAGT